MTRQVIAWGAFAEVRDRIGVGRNSTGAGPHTLLQPGPPLSHPALMPHLSPTTRCGIEDGRRGGERNRTTAGEIPDAPGEPSALLSSRGLTPPGKLTGSRPDPAASPHQQDPVLIDRSVSSSPDNHTRRTERSDEQRPHPNEVDRVGRTAATKLAPRHGPCGRGGATIGLAAALARAVDRPGSRPIAARRPTCRHDAPDTANAPQIPIPEV